MNSNEGDRAIALIFLSLTSEKWQHLKPLIAFPGVMRYSMVGNAYHSLK
jgi:hypothetical protein